MGSVKDKFPHPGFRQYQEWLLTRLDDLVNNPEVDVGIIEAPTGFGKTAVAGALAAHAAPSYFLTEQKIHQDQMVEEFPRYTGVVKGQGNYHCGRERDDCPSSFVGETCHRKPTTDNEGPLAAMSPNRGALHWRAGLDEPCPYYDKKTQAMKREIACLNYTYFFSETFYSGGIAQHGGDFADRRVMICDEAHNLGSNLQSFLSFSVNEEILERAGISLRDRGVHVSNWEQWINSTLVESLRRRQSELESQMNSQWQSQGYVEFEIHEEISEVQEILSSINRFRGQYDPEYFGDMDWAVERQWEDDDEENDLVGLEITPVSVAPFMERFLFSFADTVILMSATILDVDTLCRSLGLQQRRRDGRVWHAAFPSSFPADNRPIYYYDSPSINSGNWEDMFPYIVDLIDAVCQLPRNLDKKGIIHSVSYKNEGAIRDNLSRPTRSRLMSHGEGEGEREETLEAFKESDQPKILMSPNIYEAVDLKDDLCRFQVIPKVPFLYLGSRAVQLKRERDPSWYDWRAALRLIQSFGRGVRSEDDWADTYILDGSFEKFMGRNTGIFPDYIEDAIHKKNVTNLLRETRASVQ